ncbi:RsmB/NOP family class I SAM-dependent RNA methyltransferase [Salipiger pallidus]|nr:RsmB/NOP family class I SAM-dependent RNA methyltransferase [Salipiger pallidus]
MTPAARIAAAAEIIDSISAGLPAEKALLRWSRNSRFAGSKDRAAVRDHVFEVLRRWRSTAAQGGGSDGRSRMIGLLRQQQVDPDTIFTGEGHAPAALSDAERAAGALPEGNDLLDLPDWLADRLGASLGDRLAPAAEMLRHRAPVFLRVNTRRCSLEAAQAALADEGIETRLHGLASTALEVTAGERGVGRSAAYADGLVELQDVASQAVVEALPLSPGLRVLDYCAGGGGKALAMAARTGGEIIAHDANPERMADIPARAARAGARILTADAPEGPFDLLLCDVPCSGSGAWRRSPDGKWRLDPDGLAELCRLQAEILDTAARLVAPGGILAYATCSMLAEENGDATRGFLDRMPEWTSQFERQFLPQDGGDGFYLRLLAAPGA